MGFTRKIQYYLVHTLKYTNKEAKKLIAEGSIQVNNKVITSNTLIGSDDEIRIGSEITQYEKPFVYIKYYKPVGLVSSMNELVADSLYTVFKDRLPLFIAGRLDKYSDGLLILTNDGKWLKNITDPSSNKEKEYLVTVDKALKSNFAEQMSSGVDIKFHHTKPCQCEKLNDHEFRITLTEGKNKQIKRMCKVLGYQVIKLKRTRIDTVELGILTPGESKMLNNINML